MEDEELNKLNHKLNQDISDYKKKSDFTKNHVFEKKVLFEKLKNGRSMSEFFIKRTKQFYPDLHSKFDEVETEMEEDLIELLEKFQIYASKKTIKHSLPYTNVITSKLMLESDMSAFFRYEITFRDILKELLNKGVNKIRFYVHIETYEDSNNTLALMFGKLGVQYNFRYYIH